MAAPSSYVKTAVHGTLTVLDGTGSPVSLVVPFTRGDVSISNLKAKLNEITKIEARGKFLSHAWAARIYPAVSFSLWCGNVVGSTTSAPGALAEFLAGLGAYAANIATTGTGRPMTVDAKLTIEGSNFGDSADETITVEDLHGSFSFAEGMDGNAISFSGEGLGNVVVVNDANTVTFSQIS